MVPYGVSCCSSCCFYSPQCPMEWTWQPCVNLVRVRTSHEEYSCTIFFVFLKVKQTESSTFGFSIRHTLVEYIWVEELLWKSTVFVCYQQGRQWLRREFFKRSPADLLIFSAFSWWDEYFCHGEVTAVCGDFATVQHGWAIPGTVSSGFGVDPVLFWWLWRASIFCE